RRRRVRILENAKHDPYAHATTVFAGAAGIGYELDTLGEHRVLAIPFFSGRKPLGAGTDVVELNPIPMAGASLADRERQAGTPRLTGFLPVSPVHGPADISPGTSRNGFRCRLCDGRMYHVDDLQSGPEAQERRSGRLRLVDRVGARLHGDRPEVTFVRHFPATGKHRYRHTGRGDRQGQRAVIGPDHLVRRVGEIDAQLSAVYLHRQFQGDRFLRYPVVVELPPGNIATVRQAGNELTGSRLALVEQPLDSRFEALEAESLRHPQHLYSPGVQGSGTCSDIAGHLLGYPRVGQQEPVDFLDTSATTIQLHAGVEDALLEAVRGIRNVRRLTGHIRQVELECNVRNQLARVVEYRHDQTDVIRVGPGFVRNVQNQNIARAELVHAASQPYRRLQRKPHASEEQRHPRRLRQEAHAFV